MNQNRCLHQAFHQIVSFDLYTIETPLDNLHCEYLDKFDFDETLNFLKRVELGLFSIQIFPITATGLSLLPKKNMAYRKKLISGLTSSSKNEIYLPAAIRISLLRAPEIPKL